MSLRTLTERSQTPHRGCGVLRCAATVLRCAAKADFAAPSQHVAALLQHAIARQSGDYLKISINMHNISKDLNDYQVLTSNSQ